MSAAESQVQCTRNIALLYYLGRIGCQPTKNSVRDCEGIRNTSIDRKLPLEHEKLLTQSLAFLSSIRDNPLHVTAACVEERESGIVLIVAANAKDSHGSSEYLDAVRQGFNGIFSLLEESSALPFELLHRQVLNAIISMCRSRILSRARLTRRGQKQGFDTILKAVKREITRCTLNDDKREFMKLTQVLISRIETLQKKLAPDAATTSAFDKELELIVESFADISKITTLEMMLVHEVGPKMDSDLCRGLLNTIKKLAHYHSCAYTLVKLSRRQRLFDNISTVLVRLDASTFDKPPQETIRFELGKHMEKLKKDYNTDWDLNKINQTLAKNTEEFWKDFKKATKDSRIHAEIQLLWYLERHPSPNPPRIIASNKDACFLCNAFISFHGKYSIPRTHGRIYAGWKLPSNGLDEARRLFPKELERIFISRVNAMSRQGIMKTVYPLESTISLAAVSVTSLDGSTSLKKGEQKGTTSVTGEPCESSRPAADICVESRETIGLEEQLDNDNQTCQEQYLFLEERTEEFQPAEIESEPQKAESKEIPQAQPLLSLTSPQPKNDGSSDSSTSWDQVEKDSTKRLEIDHSLHVYIEYTTSHPCTSKVLKVKAKKLSIDDAEKVEDFCDLDSLTARDHSLGNCREVKMRFGTGVYVINLDDFVGQ
ncbi:hypothetical protein FHETE_8586 [Fusarium heterosporum]|uniref:Uncharacterized protein n=1 Tax=Fusarium heterosporum TaxID=42747 RepID=A0A8H5T209_FUSHE|nr:hypothetical protein FHETE_8586 [Fusarium heterosporum]